MKIKTNVTEATLVEMEPLTAATLAAMAIAILKVAHEGDWQQGELEGVTLKFDANSNGVFKMSDWSFAKKFVKKGYMKVAKGQIVWNKLQSVASYGLLRSPVLLFLTSAGRRALENNRSWFLYPV
jgi:hypothetical protein